MLELGCWPGGWLQVLQETVGPRGQVLGVDTEQIDELPGVRFLQLDFTEPDAALRLAEETGGEQVDALYSDAAPKLTGIRDVDRGAEEELWDAALRIAERMLRPGGTLIVKGFPGEEANAFRKQLKARFGRVAEVRPEGKRSTSKEFYWVASPYDGSRPPCETGGRPVG